MISFPLNNRNEKKEKEKRRPLQHYLSPGLAPSSEEELRDSGEGEEELLSGRALGLFEGVSMAASASMSSVRSLSMTDCSVGS